MVFEEELEHKTTFESFGVRITLESNRVSLLTEAVEIAFASLLGNTRFIDNSNAQIGPRFGFFTDSEDRLFLYRDGELLNSDTLKTRFLKYFESRLRLAVAERAAGRVFIHAGVVGWKGKAVVIPARSNTGKTTLVAELLKQGAVYFSDEYAILDTDGLVHPFPRPLSIRDWGEKNTVTNVPAGYFGCEVASRPAQVGLVLLTEYRIDGVWRPELLGVGSGILETIPHAIPLHENAKLSLEVLEKAFRKTLIAKSFRGDVTQLSAQIIV